MQYPGALEQPDTAARYYAAKREQALATLPNHTEGLDLDRVARFATGWGIPFRDFIILDPADLPLLAEIDQVLGCGESSLGWRMPNFDLSVVMRHPDIEEANGPEIFEGVLAHELTHGAGPECSLEPWETEEGQTIYVQKQYYWVKSSEFHIEGEFLSEGTAEYVRAAYNQTIGRPHGYAGHDQEWVAVSSASADDPLWVRSVYAYRTSGEQNEVAYVAQDDPATAFRAASLAGTTLHVLKDGNPQLVHALHASFKSQQGIDDTMALIDQQHPGLSGRLTRLQHTKQDFEQGLRLVASLATTH
jgi:hypothetical protein